MKLIHIIILSCLVSTLQAKVYYVSPDGKDTNTGTIDAPLATFGAGFKKATTAGDTIYFRQGTYAIQESEIMTAASAFDASHYCYTFDLSKSGNASKGRIVYAGYPGERPVFDFSAVKPSCRIVAFNLKGSYIHLKNFEITGLQATLHGHYQSICIYASNGSNNIVENVAMHHNKGIGYYATRGSNNLVLNCDAYCNFDDYSAFKTDADYENYKNTGTVKNVSETLGGNSDGFGFHVNKSTYTGNVFRGCRAWWNSDDGFDCISSQSAVTWDSCWVFYNGFEPNSVKGRGDGNGFKAGGYGAGVPCSGYAKDANGNPSIPQNVITNCIAYYNSANGFYANHHLGGNLWENNTAYYNKKNYEMLNRDSTDMATAYTNVPGYGHILRNNVSYAPRTSEAHYTSINKSLCTLEHNATVTSAASFLDVERKTGTSLADIELAAKRKPDGSLPDISFLVAKSGTAIHKNQQGALFEESTTGLSNVIQTEDNTSTRIIMEDGKLVVFHANGKKYSLSGIIIK